MTPTATQLQHRLSARMSWFINEWFFRWHSIRDGNRPVEVDMFDGRKTCLGGIEFSGSARLVYWDLIARGLRKEVIEQFAWVDDQVRRYNQHTANRAIDECADLLANFAHSIRKEAVEKDRILRGNGMSFPPTNDIGHWEGTSASEIAGQAASLKSSLPSSGDTNPSARERLNAAWNANQWWAGPLGLILGLAGLGAIFL